MITSDDLYTLAGTLRRCEGYTELHMWADAWKEIESIPDELKLTRPVLLTSMYLFIEASSWEDAAWLGLSLLERWPSDPHTRILTTLCLQKLGVSTSSSPASKHKRR